MADPAQGRRLPAPPGNFGGTLQKFIEQASQFFRSHSAVKANHLFTQLFHHSFHKTAVVKGKTSEGIKIEKFSQTGVHTAAGNKTVFFTGTIFRQIQQSIVCPAGQKDQIPFFCLEHLIAASEKKASGNNVFKRIKVLLLPQLAEKSFFKVTVTEKKARQIPFTGGTDSFTAFYAACFINTTNTCFFDQREIGKI